MIDLTDADELDVKEVRCSLSGMPISNIPNWYAGVNVRFISDIARQKNIAASQKVPDFNELDDEASEAVETGDISLEDMDEDIAIDDIIDLDDGGDAEEDV
jgi:hypothetical protein